MKIGLLGGAFDPLHNGHTMLAEKVYSSFSLDRLFFVPSKIPPHKFPHSASAAHRLEMLKTVLPLLSGNYGVLTFELDSPGVSYTVDTLKHMRRNYPEDEIYFIAGSDIFATIKSWRNWRELFSLAKFIVVRRAGVGFNEMFQKAGEDMRGKAISFKGCLHGENGGIILYEDNIPDISSTRIRKNIDSAKALVNESVLSYIKKTGLY